MTKVSGHCFAYDLLKQTMTKITPLNVVRYSHAACIIGSRQYVFGGRNNRNEQLANIEICEIGNNAAQWENLLLDQVEPRFFSVFCPISEREILILGGRDKDYRKDAFIFDIFNKQTRLVKSDIGACYECRGPCFYAKADLAVALVENYLDDWDDPSVGKARLALISFNRSSNAIRELFESELI